MLGLRYCILLGAACLGLISCSSVETEVAESEVATEVTGQGTAKNAQPRPKNTGVTSPGEYTVDTKPVQFLPKAPGIRVSSVSVPEKVVALTFDDGPHPSLTPRLLDILARHNVKATFFVLGQNVRRYPDIVRRAASAGHEIASHSDTHPQLSKCSRDKVIRELDATASAIQSATGSLPRVLRPPYGSLTKDQQQWIYNKYGYRAIMWNVDPLDWKKPGASVVASRLINGTKPGGILLAHDIHTGTIDAMEQTISGIKAKGYRFVTVSQLINMGNAAAQRAKAEADEAAAAAPASGEAPLS